MMGLTVGKVAKGGRLDTHGHVHHVGEVVPGGHAIARGHCFKVLAPVRRLAQQQLGHIEQPLIARALIEPEDA